TGGSVILAGVLLKLGTFGFLRYALWLFPKTAAAFLPAIGLIAVVGIIYGALVAMVQEVLKRLVAFSSVSHLGFVMLGIAAMTVTSVSGGVLQMVNHGISTGALFLLVGMLYERRHTRMLDDFGGLARVMPRCAAVFVLIALSSIGLPGLNGFVGEFMILVGTFESEGIYLQTVSTGTLAWAGIIAAELVAIGAIFLLAVALTRRTRLQIGRPTKVVTIAGALALATILVAPPIFGLRGGLLIQPLVGPTLSTEGFREIFALLAVIAGTGVIFAAVYMLLATQRVFFGPINHPENEKLTDLTFRESMVLGPLVIVAVLMGLFPKPFLDTINPTVESYTRTFRARAELPQLDAKSKAALRPTPPQIAPGQPTTPVQPVRPKRTGVQRRIRDGAIQRSPRLPWRRSIEQLRPRQRDGGRQ
ncbi:MAG: NADH-quinone oxidoreductase subunit M, partial [Myxococcota bacterium]